MTGWSHCSARRRTSWSEASATQAPAPSVTAREKRDGSHVALTKTVPAPAATALGSSTGTESFAQLCLAGATEEAAAMVVAVELNEGMRLGQTGTDRPLETAAGATGGLWTVR